MESIQITAPRQGVRGDIAIPGDKSISHRSVIFSAIAEGRSLVSNFLAGEDNLRTVQAFRRMGVLIEERGPDVLAIDGRGLDSLQEPDDVIDCGNSGTTIRLLSGLLAAQPFFSVLTGDPYLRKRPMRRVIRPLSAMGARIWGRAGGGLPPLAIHGGPLQALRYDSPVASAQVKSAVLLAGLYAEGETSIFEPFPSRDHTERMLASFGAQVRLEQGGVTVAGRPLLQGREIVVPGDISSAAFFMVAGLIVPGSELLIKNVGLNPTRNGVVEVLRSMGGSLDVLNARDVAGEPVADILVTSSQLHGVEIGGAMIPRLIDEIPVLGVAAACAEGTTVIRDAAELRVKETDRIAAVAAELRKLGGQIEEFEDGMAITGVEHLQGGRVDSHGDHRIAMSMAVAALSSRAVVDICDIGCTQTSFPNFWQLLAGVCQ